MGTPAMPLLRIINTALALVLMSASAFIRAEIAPPFQISETLFDFTQPETLGLIPPAQIAHHTVFNGQEKTSQYNHGAVLFAFHNKLFIQWQSSSQDEDAPETKILFSQSENGRDWSKAQTLVPARSDALVTNGGWWSDGKIFVAYINVWPHGVTPKSGYVEYITSHDGIRWSTPKRLRDAQGKVIEGVIEQDLKKLPSGRILTALHQAPGLIAKPFYTDDPRGINGWTIATMDNLPHQPGISRELEPSWFLNRQGDPVMVFRDQGSSFTVLASRSNDQGKTWSTPALTNMPDSRAKQSAGNFPDGTAYLVNNPSGSKERIPLVLTLSKNGYWFDRALLLRSRNDLSPMRYEGKYKRVGYSYPKSMLWKNQLWVSYAENKEDIVVTSVQLD